MKRAKHENQHLFIMGPEMYGAFKDRCTKEKISMSSKIRDLVNEWLSEGPAEGVTCCQLTFMKYGTARVFCDGCGKRIKPQKKEPPCCELTRLKYKDSKMFCDDCGSVVNPNVKQVMEREKNT